MYITQWGKMGVKSDKTVQGVSGKTNGTGRVIFFQFWNRGVKKIRFWYMPMGGGSTPPPPTALKIKKIFFKFLNRGKKKNHFW